MKTTTSREEIIEMVKDGIYDGFYILAQDYDSNALKELAKEILDHSNEHDEVVHLYSTDNESLFKSIRQKPRIEIINNEPRTVWSGLTIPQDKPIILVIENFDRLQTLNDQYSLSKILNRKENELEKTFINPKSIVIVSAKTGSKLDVKQAFASWFVIKKVG